MKGGVFIDYTVAPDFENGIVYFVDNSTCRVLSDSSIGAVVVQLSLNDLILSPFKKYSSSSASAIEIRNLVIKIMPTNANGGNTDTKGRLRIPCRRNNIFNYKGFEKCEKKYFETEVITHSYVYWNTMLTNGEYGFGESCTCALIHAHFPERRSPPTESEIIQSLRRLASNNFVKERTISNVKGHNIGGIFRRERGDAPSSDKQLIMNILSTNPAIIVMESLDECETLFDFIERRIDEETKKRGVASVLFEILKFTKYTRMRHVDLHHGNIMITKNFEKAYWGRGTGFRLGIASVDDTGHNYPRAFIIDFGRINLLRRNQPTYGRVSEKTIINYNGSGGLVDNLLDIVRGYEPRKFLRGLSSNLVDFRYIENLKSYRMKSTQNWCFVLLNNIYNSPTQNSPLEMYREKAQNRFPSEEEVSLSDSIVFIEEIIKDRLLNFREHSKSTVFGIPGVDIYILQNKGTGTFREKLEKRRYIPQIPREMGERLTLPVHEPSAKDEIRRRRAIREDVKRMAEEAEAEEVEAEEAEAEEVEAEEAEAPADVDPIWRARGEYIGERLYELQENAFAAGNAVVGFFYNLFAARDQASQGEPGGAVYYFRTEDWPTAKSKLLNNNGDRQAEAAEVAEPGGAVYHFRTEDWPTAKSKLLNNDDRQAEAARRQGEAFRRQSVTPGRSRILYGGSIMNNLGNEFELTNDLDMFLSNLTFDETVMNILQQSVLDFPKEDAEKLGKLFLSGRLNTKTRTKTIKKAINTLPTKLQTSRRNYNYTSLMPRRINRSLRSLVSTAAGGTRKRIKKKSKKSKRVKSKKQRINF